MSTAPAMAPAKPGDILLGKYRVEGPIGAGGMGVVMRATHLQLNQPIALKFLISQGDDGGVAADRFLREARATFRLRGENSVRVLDVGTSPTGTPFIVMEFLEGKDLREVLNERGRLPVSEAATYILQACTALEEAHAHGIVHRDLKPRNLFLTKRVDGTPIVKVLDFGISKVSGEGDENPLTNPQMAIGSPRYMAPEQWTSSTTVDARADVYATAMVLYELLTGKVALAGLPLGELIRRLSAGAIPSPRDLRPEIPESVAKVVLKGLRPHRDERYASIAQFAAALRESVPRAAPQRNVALAATAATAVVDRDVMLARAALSSALGPPSTQTLPNAPESVPSTTDPNAPAPPADAHDDDFELKTVVGAPPQMEAGPEPQAAAARAQFGKTMQSPQAPGLKLPVHGATMPLAAQTGAAAALASALARQQQPQTHDVPAPPPPGYVPPPPPVSTRAPYVAPETSPPTQPIVNMSNARPPQQPQHITGPVLSMGAMPPSQPHPPPMQPAPLPPQPMQYQAPVSQGYPQPMPNQPLGSSQPIIPHQPMPPPAPPPDTSGARVPTWVVVALVTVALVAAGVAAYVSVLGH